jgi:twitching motility protein PilT
VESAPPLSATSPYGSDAFLLQLVKKAVAAGARDVHLKVGQPPGARVGDSLVFFKVAKIKDEDTLAAAKLLIREPAVLAHLGELGEYDTSASVPGVGRLRVNVYRQRGSLAVVMRIVPDRVPSLEELGAPRACRKMAELERGLVLCVGAAGSGKSTTLAAMIGHINATMSRHIVTIEDPIEYLHEDNRSSISQREIGHDTKAFANALRAVLRQDPDVIQIGEIRDSESMEIALKAAETGHLVLSTLHTPDVARTMNRITALMSGPGDEIRERIADSLQGIVAQRLLPRADGRGMVLAAEVLMGTGSVRETIRRPLGNPPLKELMESGAEMYGMQTFEMAVRKLLDNGVIGRDAARTAGTF